MGGIFFLFKCLLNPPQAKSVASIGALGDHFGKAVDINNDSKYIISSAMHDNTGVGGSQGSAYIFT